MLFFLLYLLLPGLNGQSYLPEATIRELEALRLENRLDEAISLIQDKISEAEQLHLINEWIEASLISADFLRMKGQNASAAAVIDSVESACLEHKAGAPLLTARYYVVKGTIHLTDGDLENGKKAIINAIDLYLSNLGPEDSLLAPCYNKLGNYYFHSRIYDSAMHCYKKALALSGMKKNYKEDRASYLQNIGIIHLEQGEFDEAECCFRESLKIKETLLPDNSFSLGRIYLNIGKFYQLISDLENSFIFLDKGEKIFSAKGVLPNIELGKIYWNKGLLYYLTGDYNQALTYLFNAKRIIEEVFKDNKTLLLTLQSDIANLYTYTGDFRKAIMYYEQSLDEDGGGINVKTYRNLAKLYANEGNQLKAKECFGRAFKVLSSLQASRINSLETALTCLQYGEFLSDTGNDSAIFYFNKAHDIFSNERGFYNRDVAACFYDIGYYHFKKGFFELALKYNHLSLLSITSSPLDTNIFFNPVINPTNSDNLIINILNSKATYLNHYHIQSRDTSYLIESGKTYLRCLEIIDMVKMKYKAEDRHTILSGDIFGIYENAISQFIRIYDYTGNSTWLSEAFKTSERGKSIALLNKLKEANAKKIGLIPEYQGNAEKNIISNINLYRNNIAKEEDRPEPDTKKLDFLRANLLVYEKAYDSLISFFHDHYPEYYNLKYEHQVVSIDGLQQMLDSNEVILEYTLAKDYLATFFISRDEFAVLKKPWDSILLNDIFTLRQNLDFDHVHEYTFQDYQTFVISSHRLYSHLIRPFEKKLEGRKLIIIPDGELNYLSFESLIRDIVPTDTIAFRNLPYLLNICPVTYSASSTIYLFANKGHRPTLYNGVLAMAPNANVFTHSILAKNKAVLQYFQNRQTLPGTVWETETIVNIIKGRKLVGDEATESIFKQIAADYDILHFATHTRIDDNNPLSSMLSFFPFDLDEEDGILYTYEIYNLDLRGELAVLSACSTGDGKLQKGEGVISLARAFSYAGMPSVMMTLWDVEDISTGNIIPAFYQLIGKGFDKDIALQAAKLNYIETTGPEIETHPAFWSGFVLYGNNRAFITSTERIYYILLVILGGLIILISFVLIRKYYLYRSTLRNLEIELPEELRTQDRL